jgi:hypothetical protein
MPDDAANPEIIGEVPDRIYGGGPPARARADREYLAGGVRDFPLINQVLLARTSDDLARDLGLEIYEAMLNDPTVFSAFNVLATGILNGKFQVVPRHSPAPNEVPEPGSKRAVEIERSAEVAEFLRRQVQRLETPIKQTSFEMLFAMALCNKLAEKVFEPGTGEDEGRVCLKRLRVKRNQSWSFIVNAFGDVVAYRGVTEGGMPVDVPPKKCMVLSWMPRDGDPRGRSLLRAAYNGWNLKLNSWPKLYRYLDRFGTPINVAIAAPDAIEEDELDDRGNPTGEKLKPTRALLQTLLRLEGGSCAAFRSGTEFNIYQPTGNGEAFLHAIEIFKHEILEGILMTARALLEAEHGSKADTQEASHVVARMIVLGRESLEAMYERQLFHHLVELNWGKEDADLYNSYCSMGDVEAKDLVAAMGAFTKALWTLDDEHFPIVDAMFGLPPRKVKPANPDALPALAKTKPSPETAPDAVPADAA